MLHIHALAALWRWFIQALQDLADRWLANYQTRRMSPALVQDIIQLSQAGATSRRLNIY